MELKIILALSTPPTALVALGAIGKEIGQTIGSLGLETGLVSTSSNLINLGIKLWLIDLLVLIVIAMIKHRR